MSALVTESAATVWNRSATPQPADSGRVSSLRLKEAIEERFGVDRLRRMVGGDVECAADDDGLRLLAPSAFAAERLTRTMGAALRELARSLTGDPDATIRVVPRPSAPASEPVPPRRTTPRRSASRPDRVDPSRFAPTLDQFVVGPCNELAHQAARSLAEVGSAGTSRAIFLHGECGNGKTHLLRGLAVRFRESHPGARVLYETGEAFTNRFLSAIRSGDLESFRARHRDLDLLCLDDVHFLSRKTKTQSEFLYTFDSMELGGSCVALASDEPPARIERLSRELVSRFSAGVVARLDAPDALTVRGIVEAVAARFGLRLTEDAVTLVARLCDASPREIAGAVAGIDAYRRLLPQGRALGGCIDAAGARAALGHGFGAARRRPVRLEQIIRTVAESVGVTTEEILSQSRRGRVVIARSMASHLARTMAGRSFQEIADALRRSTHSTAFTACKRVEAKIAADEPLGVALDLPVRTWSDLALELERRVRAQQSSRDGRD